VVDEDLEGTVEKVGAFELDRTEVSVASYRACVVAGACSAEGLAATGSQRCTYAEPDADDLPITCVTWSQAESYCAFRKARLPTVEEWSSAAGATREDPFAAAEPAKVACLHRSKEGPCPVASTAESARGVYHLRGNVAEWTVTRAPVSRHACAIGRRVCGASFRFDDTSLLTSPCDLANGEDHRDDQLGFRCARGPAPEVSPPRAGVVREETTVTVDGRKEAWSIEWMSRREPACAGADWGRCDCHGLAFGEAGRFHVVRRPEGGPEDRLCMTGVLPRFPVLPSDKVTSPPPLAELEKRKPVSLLQLADYDHDGWSTEFVLRVPLSEPCGFEPSILVGVSRADPKLHVFGTVGHPEIPLLLDLPGYWDLVRRSNPARFESVPCGKRGVETSTTLEVQGVAGGFHVTVHEHPCPGLAGAASAWDLDDRPREAWRFDR
jgi:Sulfatase-modifying factor enzyme 1